MKFIIFSAIFLSCFFTSIHSEILDNYQDINTKVVLTKKLGEFKKPEFQKEILPHDFTYFIDLLQYGNKTKQSRAYTYSLVKLFSNILKGSEYVNSYAFSTLLEQLPNTLKDYFIVKKGENCFGNKTLYDADTLDRFKKMVNIKLYTKLSSEFEVFKKEPEKFLDILSGEIMQIAEEEMSIEQLRQSIIRFLEIGLSKLVWSPEDEGKTWESVKTVSHQLATLVDNNILVDVNDLDDLFWTLVYRYCYFLDITGLNLPIEFYEKVKSDIAGQQLLFLELEEQDSLLESKTSYLTRSLLQAEVKCRAYKKGIVVK